VERENKKRILLILKRTWDAFDVSGEERTYHPIPQGCHEVERIEDPYGKSGTWLVLTGTKIGGPEKYWKSWKGSGWKKFEVIIREE
tara:strand:- start:131 stop:388 length:258 start_codon:yes stop_codon:yes gene_type:complete